MIYPLSLYMQLSLTLDITKKLYIWNTNNKTRQQLLKHEIRAKSEKIQEMDRLLDRQAKDLEAQNAALKKNLGRFKDRAQEIVQELE